MPQQGAIELKESLLRPSSTAKHDEDPRDIPPPLPREDPLVSQDQELPSSDSSTKVDTKSLFPGAEPEDQALRAAPLEESKQEQQADNQREEPTPTDQETESSDQPLEPTESAEPSISDLELQPLPQLNSETPSTSKKHDVQDVLKLDNFIEQKILAGWDDEKIAKALQDQGFAQEIIELCQRRVLRKIQNNKGLPADDKTPLTGLIHNIRNTFSHEQKLAENIVAPASKERTALEIAHLDNWIEDKIVNNWTDHQIMTALLRQGWAHDIIRERQLKASQKLTAQPHTLDQEEHTGIGQFIKSIRKTFKKEEGISERFIDEIEDDKDKQDDLQERIEEHKELSNGALMGAKDQEQDDQIMTLKTSIDRLDAQISALNEFRKVVNERFIRVAEESGSMRGNIVNVEKSMRDLTVRMTRAVDLVEAVQPQKLFTEVKKVEAKVDATKAKYEGSQEIYGKIMDEVKDVRSKLAVVRGVEEIMKLHDDIKQQFVQVQQMRVVSERHADKVESLFIEMNKRVSSLDAFEAQAKNLEGTSTEVLKQLQKIKSREMEYLTKDQLDKRTKPTDDNLKTITTALNQLEQKVSSLDQGTDLQKFKKEVGDAQEVILGSVNEVKGQIGKIHNQVKESNKQAMDDVLYRIEQLEQKQRQGGPAPIGSSVVDLTPVMSAINELRMNQQKLTPPQATVNQSMPSVVPQQSVPTPQPIQLQPTPSDQDPQVLASVVDLAKKEFAVLKKEMEELRAEHNDAGKNDLEHVQDYLSKLRPSITKNQIVNSFINLGWPKEVIDTQIDVFEQRTGKKFI